MPRRTKQYEARKQALAAARAARHNKNKAPTDPASSNSTKLPSPQATSWSHSLADIQDPSQTLQEIIERAKQYELHYHAERKKAQMLTEKTEQLEQDIAAVKRQVVELKEQIAVEVEEKEGLEAVYEKAMAACSGALTKINEAMTKG